MKILIILQSPSFDNINPNIPLIGTRSYRTVLGWLGETVPNYSEVKFHNACSALNAKVPTADDLGVLLQLINSQKFDRIIAMGKVASWSLRSIGVQIYFEMEHPSGLNRRLNDKKYVDKKLTEMRQYICG